MKTKNGRKFYLFLLVIFCIGAITGGIYKNVLKERYGDFKFNRSFMTDEFEFDYKDIDSIDIDADIVELEIKEGSDFTVSYKYTEGYEPKVRLDGRTLNIDQDNPDINLAGSIESKLTITVPKKAKFDIIDIQAALGDVEIEDVTASKIDIDASLGNVEISDINCNEIDIDASLGNVEVSGSYDKLDVDASLGNIKVQTDKPEKEVELDLDADLGSIEVNGKKHSNY